MFYCWWYLPHSKHVTQARRQLREIGGAKLKSGGKGFRRNARAFSGRNRKFSDQKQVISKKKGLRRNPKVFSGRNRKFSDQKQKSRWSPKNKVYAEILRLFLAKIANSNVFWAQKHQLKKYRGGQEKNRGGIAPPAPPLATLDVTFVEGYRIDIYL